MAIEIGTYISNEMKEYINTFVDPLEKKSLVRKYDFSVSLAGAVLSGDRPITSNTFEYFQELLKLASKNRTQKMKLLNKVHREVSSIK